MQNLNEHLSFYSGIQSCIYLYTPAYPNPCAIPSTTRAILPYCEVLKYLQIGLEAKTKGHAGNKHGHWTNTLSRASEGQPPVKRVRAAASDLHMNLRHSSICGPAASCTARISFAASSCGLGTPCNSCLWTIIST